MIELYCKNCGGTLQPISEDICKCENCGSTYTQVTAKKQQELLDGFLNKQKQDKLNSLRRHLWQEVTAKFIDSSKIISICLDIKNIYPNDFLANFYEVACGKNTAQTTDFIDQIDAQENYDTIEQVVNFLIKSLKSEYLLSVNNLIERAYKGRDLQTYNRLTTAFASQAELVEEGVYEINIPRDVFVAYSSADMAYVQQAVTALEEQGITCFVAMRNLQHGAGAVDNYQHALESAMDNCKIVLFISSKNSRSLKCDAVKHELPYLKKSDLAKLSLKFPNVPYEKIDYRYKKPRIQWRIDDNKSLAVDRLIGEIFNGLEYCYSVDSVIERVGEYLFGETYEEEPSAVQKQLEEQNKLLQKQLEQQKEFLKKQAEEQEKRLKEELKKKVASLNNEPQKSPNVSESKQPALKDTNVNENSQATLTNTKVGDYIKFGKYPQSDANTKEDIEWLVLDTQGSKALVISKYALDCQKYNDKKIDVTWETCSLRKWLNGKFINTAFSTKEKKFIQTTLVSADKNPDHKTNPGNETEDKVFLLSIQQRGKYLPITKEKFCKPTKYAKDNKLFTSSNDACSWWLRSPGYCQTNASSVQITGYLDSYDSVICDNAVRPAMWVELDEQAKQDNQVSKKTILNKPVKSYKNAEVGDIIQFGKYPQSVANTKEDIEWLVLDKQEGKLLVISKYGLDRKKYNEQFEEKTTWENCSLRNWLNNEFINNAFTSEESKKIQASCVRADKNPSYNTNPGISTNDKVFLLSTNEVNKYFTSDKERECKITAYAKGSLFKDKNDNCDWWLRSPGKAQDRASIVGGAGSVNNYGNYVGNSDNAVRPAMWIYVEEPKKEEPKTEESTTLSKAKKADTATKTAVTKTTATEKATATTKTTKTAVTKTTATENIAESKKEPAKTLSATAEAKPLAKTEAKKQDDKYKKGAIITLGSYPQSSSTQKEPIEWKIIKKQGNKALLISKHALDTKVFHSKEESITWENCSLRTWLNTEFFNTAFLDSEKAQVVTSTVEAQTNPRFTTSSGNPTKDKVFILSLTEAETYFTSDSARACEPTEYAITRKARYDIKTGKTTWWLRTPGSQPNRATQVSMSGFVLGGGQIVNGDSSLYIDGVRPAIWVYTDETREPVVSKNTTKNLNLSKEVKTTDDKYKKGAIITFGNYPLVSEDKKEPIEWEIIDKQDSQILVISKYGLDGKKFDEEYLESTWDDCTLRTWLNNEFLNQAFKKEEQSLIKTSLVKAEATPGYVVYPGNSTNDKIFLLSVNEANKYFSSKSKRQCKVSEYAVKNKAYKWSNENCSWWLRSTGFNALQASFVSHLGEISTLGYKVNDGSSAVRPALWIDTKFAKNGQINLKLEKDLNVIANTQTPASTVLNKIQEVKEETQKNVTLNANKNPTATQTTAVKTATTSDNCPYKVGDLVAYGYYPQSSANTRDLIEWKVIDKQGGNLLLISKYALDSKKFNENYVDTVWKNCSLRAWLNGEFIKKAFTTEQINGIIPASVVPEARPDTIGNIGETTTDKVFILSISEAERYFKYNAERGTTPTAYALKQGVYSYDGHCCYWLRNVGNKMATDVYHGGHIDKNGYSIISSIPAVRPAMWVSGNAIKCGNLKSAEPALSSQPATNGKPQPAKVAEKPKIALIDAKVGDIITFGSYSQSSASEKEPIEWIVLEKKLSKILVISKMGLINKKFNEKLTKVTWEDCSLRSWLNKQFVDSAFNAKELSQIETTSVYYEKLGLFKKKKAAGVTQDKVFLLSVDEAQFHLTTTQKKCVPTAVAKKQGIYTDSFSGNCWWFLRTPGSEQKEVAIVFSDGKINENGNSVDSNYGIVRPAMWIKY